MTLIAVTKSVPVEAIREAIALGLSDVGENRVQEAERKIAELGRGVRWHFVGHLQSNKARLAVQCFDRIHSVDDLALAQELSRRAQSRQTRLPILLEVNIGEEPGKFGIVPEALPELVEATAGLAGIELRGLMTVGRFFERPEEARPQFARLRQLRDLCERRSGLKLPELSMGMSGDFEVAVEEGASWVRVGTAIFGPRA